MVDQHIYDALVSGPAYPFSEPLSSTLPLASPGVYTIWDAEVFLYVGNAGRGLDTTLQHRKMRGLKDRLGSHREVRRSGSTLLLYICDRLIVPELSREEIDSLRAGNLSLNKMTQQYVHSRLSYRFAITKSFSEATSIERRFRRGQLPVGPPFLNAESLKSLT